MQHVFLKTGPIRGRGLSLLDRLFYLEPVVYWLTYPFMVLVLLAPIVFWFTGVAAFRAGAEQTVLLLLPRLLAGYVIGYWLSEGKVLPIVTTVHKALPAFHLTATALQITGRPVRPALSGDGQGNGKGSRGRPVADRLGLPCAGRGAFGRNGPEPDGVVRGGADRRADGAGRGVERLQPGAAPAVLPGLRRAAAAADGCTAPVARADVIGTVRSLCKRLFA